MLDYYAVASYRALVAGHGFELVDVYDDPRVSAYYLARRTSAAIVGRVPSYWYSR